MFMQSCCNGETNIGNGFIMRHNSNAVGLFYREEGIGRYFPRRWDSFCFDDTAIYFKGHYPESLKSYYFYLNTTNSDISSYKFIFHVIDSSTVFYTKYSKMNFQWPKVCKKYDSFLD
jgi:hypothetical protein